MSSFGLEPRSCVSPHPCGSHWRGRAARTARSPTLRWVRALSCSFVLASWPAVIDATEWLERSGNGLALDLPADKENNPIPLSAGHYSGEIDSFRRDPHMATVGSSISPLIGKYRQGDLTFGSIKSGSLLSEPRSTLRAQSFVFERSAAVGVAPGLWSDQWQKSQDATARLWRRASASYLLSFVGRTNCKPETIRSEPCKMAKSRIGAGASPDP
jgi:hypothetical protein